MRFDNNFRRCEIWRHSEQYDIITLVRRVTELKRRTTHHAHAIFQRTYPKFVVCHTIVSTIVFAASSRRRPLTIYTNAKWSDLPRCTAASGPLDFSDFTARLRTPSWPNPQTVRRRRICGTVSTAWKPAKLESTKWTVTGLLVRVRTTACQEKASSVWCFHC